ncbi:hypothetical protein IGI43_000752 [Enterococcus sp. AZ126]
MKKRNQVIKNQLELARFEISKDIESFWNQYAEEERITYAEARKRASKMDVEAFSSKAKEYVKKRDFTSKANKDLKMYNLKMRINRLQLLQNEIELEIAKMGDLAAEEMYKWFRTNIQTEYRRQSGILGESINLTNSQIEALIYRSHEYADFMDVWDNHREILNTELNRILRQALISGKNPKVFIRDVRGAFDATYSQAKRLLVTETTNLQTFVQADCIKKAGYDRFEFVPESSACPVCLSKRGKSYLLQELQRGYNAPPIHPNCRCSIIPFVESEV